MCKRLELNDYLKQNGSTPIHTKKRIEYVKAG